MLMKIIKIISFVVYSWTIYNFYFFALVTGFFYAEGFEFNIDYLHGFYHYTSQFFIYPVEMLSDILDLIFIRHVIPFCDPYLDKENNDCAVPFAFICILTAIVLYAWWKRQTIIRAWIMALTGSIAGPGLLLLIMPLTPHSLPFGIPAFIGINLFFSLLLAGNRLQKKYYPDNRLANRIRWLLKWPCLRT